MHVYQHSPFSCETENQATAAILVLSILINHSYFQSNALEPGTYRFSGSASVHANRGYSGHHFIIDLPLLLT